MTDRAELINRITARREQLGIPDAVLAARSGLSEPALEEMLSPDGDEPQSHNLDHLSAVMDALGIRHSVHPSLSVDELRYRQADAKARRLVQLVQGSAALEEQGVRPAEFERLVAEARQELLDGSNHRLWAD